MWVPPSHHPGRRIYGLSLQAAGNHGKLLREASGWSLVSPRLQCSRFLLGSRREERPRQRRGIPETEPMTGTRMLSHRILTLPRCRHCHHPHFIDGQTGANEREVTCQGHTPRKQLSPGPGLLRTVAIVSSPEGYSWREVESLWGFQALQDLGSPT